MSGGSLDYAFCKVNNIIEDIEEILDDVNYTNEFTEQEMKSLRTLVKRAEHLAEGLRAAEWWLSSDTDSQDFVAWTNNEESTNG
jgi:hypothetical protein